MYSVHLHRHKQSLLKNEISRVIKDTSQLSERAYNRLEEWKSRNSELIQSVYGKVAKKKEFPKLRQNSHTPKPLTHTENPYRENGFIESLRKTEKSKHLGKYFIRVNYLSVQERMNTSMQSNFSIDVVPPQNLAKRELKLSTVKKQMEKRKASNWTPDPFCDPCNESIFRQRQKTLEPSKAFFVTTKVHSPKTKLLISQKFSDFYNSLHGKKLYKNSLPEIYRS